MHDWYDKFAWRAKWNWEGHQRIRFGHGIWCKCKSCLIENYCMLQRGINSFYLWEDTQIVYWLIIRLKWAMCDQKAYN